MNKNRETLLEMYRAVRKASIDMCAPLRPDDHQVQTMEEVSPPKWNLGHTSWFFWQFILRPRGLTLPEDEAYRFFLNSYYHRAGKRGLRGKRGMVTRPSLDEIYSYRRSVDERIEKVIGAAKDAEMEDFTFVMTVGVNHEQQHQELFHSEIKNIYSANPPSLRPVYRKVAEIPEGARGAKQIEFLPFEGGVHEFGNLERGWCWDNELGVHKALIEGFELQDRLVTNGEYLEFMEDGGYSNSLIWLSDGWFEVEKQEWEAPLYWEKTDGEWRMFTLSGMRKIVPDEPVCHVSYYEADAYAQWKGETDSRFKSTHLPSELEWELAARLSGASASEANLFDTGVLHPVPCGDSPGSLKQIFGDVWEWTRSSYGPYPGFEEFPNDLSEYNGKFMNNQRVLRGGSCVTPKNHIRVSYRNFWPPATRFQFTGIRLAKDPG